MKGGNDMTDSEIIELYNQRDERAIRETQTAYGRYCEKIARNILGDEQEALECVNETLLKAWENIPPEQPQILSAYLATLTRNYALLCYRRGAAAKRGKGSAPLVLEDFAELIPSSTNVERIAEHHEIIAEINRYLEALPEVNRTVFVLRFFCFESIPDIADRLGLKKKAVSATLYRTKKQIRKHLDKEGYSL